MTKTLTAVMPPRSLQTTSTGALMSTFEAEDKAATRRVRCGNSCLHTTYEGRMDKGTPGTELAPGIKEVRVI